MTYRITEADLKFAVERLNRNLESKGSDVRVSVVHQNGWINLFSSDHKRDYSNGNTKTELYWQVQLANKMLETI